MSIFIGYGLLLGVVGCVFGTGLGLTITTNINEIEQWLTHVTGKALEETASEIIKLMASRRLTPPNL